MNWRSTMRSTISVAVIATMLAGCAAKPGEIAAASDKHFGGRSNSDLGVATRALAALQANDFATAVAYAERAVEKTPQDAGFRTLLGNAYFAAGRFHSAEQAYRDALMLYGAQPKTVLKLALAQIAQGKNDEALRSLESGRDYLDASDYGLALALAGRPVDAVSVLDQAARNDNADARVRQNLALAYALSGDWNQARVIAAQDVAGTDLDARMKEWMALASPAKPSDQVAALLGVTPAASDAGQPVRLALGQDGDTRSASAAAPQPAPVAVAEALSPAPVASPAMPAPTYASAAVAVADAPVAAPQALSDDDIAALPAIEVAPAPAFADAAPAAPSPDEAVRVAATSPAEAPMALMAIARTMLPKVRKAASKKSVPSVTMASAPIAVKGRSNAVVQLGAYSNAGAVQVAWDRAAAKFAALRDYAPMSARFDSGKGVFYRLSVHGFASQRDAASLCASLKSKGRACFVRTVAGDTPIQLASR